MIFASLLFLSVASAAAPVSGLTRESDMTIDRHAFATVPLVASGATIRDVSTPPDQKSSTAGSDMVEFSPAEGSPLPPTLIDLQTVNMAPTDDGWKVEFSFIGSLPQKPDFPVNIDLFVDRDGRTSNNAETGVFRAGSDMAFLLLYGVKTGWHTLTWQYDVTTMRWIQMTTPIEFQVASTSASMVIPYALLPRQTLGGQTVRAFALTSKDGVTVVDVAPGHGLPPRRADTFEQQLAAASSPMDGKWLIVGILTGFCAAAILLTARARR